MPKLALDDFVEGLQIAVAQARASLEETNRGRLERMIELAGDGRNQALTWSFVIDGDGAGERGARTVRLPLISLRRNLISEVAEVRVELKATIEESAVLRKGPPRRRLRLVVARSSALLRQRLHRLAVCITGRQPINADVSIDDVSWKTVSFDYEPAVARLR